MAKKTKLDPADSKVSELIKQKQAAWDALAIVRATWPDKERLLVGRLSDSFSQRSTRSHVTDAHLSTLVFERQSRVASQLPSGKIYSLSSKEKLTAELMDLVVQKYVIPNANSQFDMLTKLRMSGVYASVYGAQPMMYDYRVDDDYIGPDVYLIPVRNFFPQPGFNSIESMNWCMVSRIDTAASLQAILDRPKTQWNKENIKKLLDRMKNGAAPSRDLNSDKKSSIENTRTTGVPYPGEGGTARVELVQKFEKGKNGRWITFAPDYPDVGPLRDIANPHKNGKIPIVMRQCFPLVDSIFGLGDFERGITLQKAKDSLINLYLDGVKMSIFPPMKVDASGVTMSTIRQEAGARWLVKDMDAVQPYMANPQGLQTFQGTYQFLTSALLNQNGTTDTATSATESGNPAFGKTPEAIEQLKARENARDNWDRFMLEQTWEKLIGGITNLIGENQEAPINFHIFDADLEELIEKYEGKDQDDLPPYLQRINPKVGKLTLSKKWLGGKYQFIVDPSSSLTQDNKAEHESITELIGMYLQNPQIVDALLQRDGYKFNFGGAMKRATITSGINDWDDIISEINDNEGQDGEQPETQENGEMQPQAPQMAPQGMPQMSPQMPAEMPAEMPPQAGPVIGGHQFSDPHIAAVAQHLFGGGQ